MAREADPALFIVKVFPFLHHPNVIYGRIRPVFGSQNYRKSGVATDPFGGNEPTRTTSSRRRPLPVLSVKSAETGVD